MLVAPTWLTLSITFTIAAVSPAVTSMVLVAVKPTSVVVCPVDVIHPTKDEAGFAAAEQLYIHPTDCIDCGLCVSECPVAAIFQDEDVPGEFEEFIEKNAAYYRR